MELSLGLHRRDAAWPAAVGRRCNGGLGGPSSILLGGLLPPPPRARAAVLHTAALRAPSSPVASNNDVDAAARDIVSSSFECTMGHMRNVPRLDVSTVSPHYAGALDDATTGDGGGRTRHRVCRASPAPKDDTTTTTTAMTTMTATTTTAAPAVATVRRQQKKDHDD